MSTVDPENLITVSAAADAKGCSRTTIYRAIDDSRLTGVEVGNRKMVVHNAAFTGFEPEMTGYRREKYNGRPDISE